MTASLRTGTSTTPRGPSIWRRAPGWWFHAFCAVGAIGLLWSVSYPHGSLVLEVLSFWWLAVCALVWLIRAITYLGSRSRSGAAWPFAIAPMLGVVVLGIGFAALPLQARWTASRGAFDERADALVERVERGDAEPGATLIRDDRIGLYTVEYAHVDENGNVYFSVANTGFIDGGGFARLDDGPPAHAVPDDYEHLGGDWYVWRDRF